MRMVDLTGRRFGRQVAVECVGKTKYGNYIWMCRCDCGNQHAVPSGQLIRGKSRSCGCLAREASVKSLERHGITTGGKPRTLTIWSGMKARCYNANSVSYRSYGGRGIGICDEWLTFENFHRWAMSNGYQDGLQIDRIDNDAGYCPKNCRWVPVLENRRNRQNTRRFECRGEFKTIGELSETFGIPYSILHGRVYRGWDIERAVTTPS